MTNNKIDERFIDKVVIHRRNTPARLNNNFPFDQIIEQYGDDIIFVSSNEDDYRAFPYQHIPFVKISTLDEWFTTINSCGLMISNLTSPAVIAHALDIPRIIEIPNTPDAIHCMG
jgi:ADP-heptose:LPS heptosyltransferase